MASTWDINYKDKPDGGDSPSTLDNEQRTHRLDNEVRMENEHDTFEDGTAGLASADWRHKEGSARAYYQSAEPTDQPGANGAALGADDDGRIWVDSDNLIQKVWDGTSFEMIQPYTILHITDEKADGVEGGTFTQGAWRKRTLNTEVINTISGSSLVASQITLPAGTYEIDARAPGYQVTRHKAKLRNTTDNTDDIIGSSAVSVAADNGFSDSIVKGVITIADTKVFELQHYCEDTTVTRGFGYASNFGVVEIYAEITIKRLS